VNRREYWSNFEYEEALFDNYYQYDLIYCFNKDLKPENANVFYDFFNVLITPEYPKPLERKKNL